MNNEIPINILIQHLVARRQVLKTELDELKNQITRVEGAIAETITLEMQFNSGTIATSRFPCE